MNIHTFPWTGQFQTKAEIDAYLSGDQIVCLQCGSFFYILAAHIKSAHHISVHDYKLKYGIHWNRGLTCAGTRAKYSNLMKSKQAAGILPQKPSPEHMAMLRKIPASKHRPMQPATKHATAKLGLAQNGRDENWQLKDYEEYLTRIATGRTIKEVGLDADVPANYLFYKFCRANPDFQTRYEKVWDKLPFHVQVRGQHTGNRFKKTVVKLREIRNFSWSKIADMMSVKESTVRSTYHHLKHSGKLHEYRAAK